MSHSTLRWSGDHNGQLMLLDQTRLPLEVVEVACADVETVFEAIQSLRVRGAPAIGVTAAYGVCVGLQRGGETTESLFARLDEVTAYLARSRPTAVNLFWALDRMRAAALALRRESSPEAIRRALFAEAQAIHREDREMCHAIGRQGAALMPDNGGVLTHCNAGALAASEYGTGLAPIFSAHAAGKRLRVFVDETRPLLQGARLTAWELMQAGIDATLICDSMAAHVMQQGKIQAVCVGADRIAANGDAANKIGTYGVALAAAAHGIPFYVAAPSSTFDLTLASGEGIPIEERRPEEITEGFGRRTAPEGVQAYNPAFDVTPARLIAAIICERGVIAPVTRERIAEVLQAAGCELQAASQKNTP